MKVEKILKQFQLFYKNSENFQFAIETSYDIRDSWRDGKAHHAMYFAFTATSIFIGTSQPKSTIKYELATFANMYFFEVHSAKKKNRCDLVFRGYSSELDEIPIFSLTIANDQSDFFKDSLLQFEHNSQIKFLTDSQMAISQLSNPSLPRSPQMESPKSYSSGERFVTTSEAETRQVTNGNEHSEMPEKESRPKSNPVAEKGALMFFPSANFNEFQLDVDLEISFSQSLDVAGSRLEFIKGRISTISSLLAQGEKVLYATFDKNEYKELELSVITNRRVLEGVEVDKGQVFARSETPLFKIKRIFHASSYLTLEVLGGEIITLGKINAKVFENLHGYFNPSDHLEATPSKSKRELFGISTRAMADLERFGKGVAPLVVAGDAQGVLAAWKDRVAIVKQGVFAMASNDSKQQSNVFFFEDILQISIELKGFGGISGGIVQVVTPGHPTRDLTSYSQNSAGTFSNVLSFGVSMNKEYAAAVSEIQELLTKYKSQNKKRPNDGINVASGGLVDQLRDLQSLKDQGVLTDEEFLKAKSKLLE